MDRYYGFLVSQMVCSHLLCYPIERSPTNTFSLVKVLDTLFSTVTLPSHHKHS